MQEIPLFDLNTFSIIATKYVCGLKSFRKPVSYLENAFSRYGAIWLQSIFSNIFDSLGWTLTGR